MRLGDLMEGIDTLEWMGDTNLSITNISYHSNKIRPGSVFVAIQGFRSDGHKYISDALSRGAVAFVISKDMSQIAGLTNFTDKIAVIKVKDTRSALSRMAANFYKYPAKALNLVGVTGTNGKTTISYLIHALMSQGQANVGQIGSLGIYSGNQWKESSHTTPESLELQKILRKMVDTGSESCVMEVSSHALELDRVKDIEFNGAVFSNLTHEHLDFHKSMVNYYKAKRKLFYMASDFNVINIDDPYGKRLADELSNRQVPIITYGIKEDADCKAQSVNMQKNHTDFHITTPVGEMTLKTFLPGKYNIYNCLAAVACANMLGLKPFEIKTGLEQVKQIPGRFELIRSSRNVNIIIDYAHTPDGFRKLLETVSSFAEGRIIMVFGCVGERDQSKRSLMGEIASQYCDLCILTTDNCRSEDPKAIIEQIKKGFSITTNYVDILDREAAIRYAILQSRENDTILITGKGHERRQIIGDKEYYFNEREIVSKALKEFDMLRIPGKIDLFYQN